ncbi:MAG: NADH:ubiquinone reductase (Na(+)-transporting) subunit A [Gammaproteobacteria bacterium]|nr:MAG: NADH:ubiquinone reductase (Na(+)-transporting) subunit A [Gammaproteobacteria bacterium]
MIKLKRGLNVPISGEPEQRIESANTCRSVAILGDDYFGMKPTMAVSQGDKVKLGQTLFTDKKNPDVKFTAPAAGTVTEINRGHKRVFQSIVIEIEGGEEVTFNAYPRDKLSSLSVEEVKANLIDSGLWTSIRTRPFSKVPDPSTKPSALFITAMDSNPLAADAGLIISQRLEAFQDGVQVLSALSDGKTYVCKSPETDLSISRGKDVQVEDFAGPHPAGLAGTHIHFLDPVSESKTVWCVNYQDVIAIGDLFATGKLSVERVISIAGPQVEKPRLLKTRVGANLKEMVAGQLKVGENRVISGSVLSGRTSGGVVSYLGRYHSQVSVILEGRERQLIGYLRPGADKHSVMSVFLSKFLGSKKFPFTSTTNGSERAMVPVGAYESVMPLDILPTQLLRALLVKDTETAQMLGCLELEEEDLALCTYACPGKYEYGPILRDNLTCIEKEG